MKLETRNEKLEIAVSAARMILILRFDSRELYCPKSNRRPVAQNRAAVSDSVSGNGLLYHQDKFLTEDDILFGVGSISGVVVNQE